MPTSLWTQANGKKIATIQERTTTVINLPVADSSTTTTKISGKLPPGMRLEDNQVLGTPFEVVRNTVFEFCIRATLNDKLEDRTYSIEIQGSDAPEWTTPEGLLEIGKGGSYFILDNSAVDFQLMASDKDTKAGQKLEYFIASKDGELPPGITLTTEGKLVGIVEPILAIEKAAASGVYDTGFYGTTPFDFGVRSSNGYDSFFYDSPRYDISTPTRSPKKLNRYYEFTVSVSDGEVIAKRKFQIYVVGDDFLRADNTIMQIGTGIFTSDVSFVRTPIWLTPSNLGYKRANNYVTLFLDVLDNPNIVGELVYSLQSLNDDGSASVLPDGLTLDSVSGEVAGTIPYQPEVTREFKFTVRATRTIGTEEEEAISDKTFTLTLLGDVNSEINWISGSDLGNVSSNYISTLSIKATTNVPGGQLIYSLVSGNLPPGLSLSFDGEIIGKINPFGTSTNPGITIFDTGDLILDGNTTTMDRKFEFTVEVQDKFKYSRAQKTFTIGVADPDNKDYSSLFMKPFFKKDLRSKYLTFISDPDVFPPESIYRPNDTNFGLQKNLKMLAYAGIETKNVQEYVAATTKNHKRKSYYFGDIKRAVAKTPGTNDIVYEIIYAEIIDPADVAKSKGVVKNKITINNKNKVLVNQVSATPENNDYDSDPVANISITTRSFGDVKYKFGADFDVYGRTVTYSTDVADKIVMATRTSDTVNVDVEIGTPAPYRILPEKGNVIKTDTDAITIDGSSDNVRYISNLTQMRENIKKIGTTEGNFLPLWMRTAQENTIEELGFVAAVPLCYCKPGTSVDVLNRIDNNGFDFKDFNFDIDRYTIDSTTGNSAEQYILFGNYKFNI